MATSNATPIYTSLTDAIALSDIRRQLETVVAAKLLDDFIVRHQAEGGLQKARAIAPAERARESEKLISKLLSEDAAILFSLTGSPILQAAPTSACNQSHTGRSGYRGNQYRPYTGSQGVKAPAATGSPRVAVAGPGRQWSGMHAPARKNRSPKAPRLAPLAVFRPRRAAPRPGRRAA